MFQTCVLHLFTSSQPVKTVKFMQISPLIWSIEDGNIAQAKRSMLGYPQPVDNSFGLKRLTRMLRQKPSWKS